MITLKGVVSRISFQNPDNFYTVCRLKVDRVSEQVTLVGKLPGVAEGETLVLEGRWTSHSRYGDQFQVERFQVALPATVSGIRKYLSSGLIRGISKMLAGRIVDKFQDQTLEIIENEPERLMEVNGIGAATQARVIRVWNEHHAVRRVMQFLQEAQISVDLAGVILKTYGNGAMEVLTTDPYRLARDIPALGFRAADTIARSQGMDPGDEGRLAAGLACCLAQFEQEGHVYAPKAELMEQAGRLTGVESHLFEPALTQLADDEVVRLWGNQVYPHSLFKAESGIANRIKAMLTMPAPGHAVDEDQILEQVLSSLAVKLSGEQLAAVSQILEQRVSVITGGPGTGKTTLVRALCHVFKKQKLSVLLAAPTGRAARRLAQVTGKKAFTLHKLLEFDPDSHEFGRNFSNPLELDAMVVDEVSMVDTELMYRLLEALPVTACLILVGDTFQLPSVGPGNVLADIMASGRVRVFSLTHIFRQARQSPIICHAHAIRNGDRPEIKGETPEAASEFYFIENQSPTKVVQTILELCANRIPKAFPHIEEVQVLTPMHKGEAGTLNLNQQLQAALNPEGEGMEANGMVFRAGDKVMHLKNNYEKEVFNGDIGLVHEILKSEGQVLVDYDGRVVPYEVPELDELTLAYAVSVHKSQGSEYGAVVIALTTAHRPLLQRNLLYTAMTRGKHLVIMVGSSRAFDMAFDNDKTTRRLSGLKKRLKSD
ncbi:MAG: ATP-dependent RecD-like DNA helicase [Desulfobacterales bacterium]|nr:ATP-dependent RecD-like DNA helicase [Desulfobacterales bacterium]